MNDRVITKPHARTGRPHLHVEAFCLMRYTDMEGNVEVIWNSRDGVTPFIVHSPAGLESQHTNWHLDEYAPLYVPDVGERIFVDMTEQMARAIARRRIEQYWSHPEWPASKMFASKEAGVEVLYEDYYGNGRAPALIEVTEGIREQLVERRRAFEATVIAPSSGAPNGGAPEEPE